MEGEKIFLQYGFDLEISVKDVFTLEALGGILFLHLLRENGDRIISRRRISMTKETRNLSTSTNFPNETKRSWSSSFLN